MRHLSRVIPKYMYVLIALLCRTALSQTEGDIMEYPSSCLVIKKGDNTPITSTAMNDKDVNTVYRTTPTSQSIVVDWFACDPTPVNIGAIFLHTDPTTTTSGRIAFAVGGAACGPSNIIGAQGAGEVFNCNKSGTNFALNVNVGCYPELAIVELRIFKASTHNPQGTPYLLASASMYSSSIYSNSDISLVFGTGNAWSQNAQSGGQIEISKGSSNHVPALMISFPSTVTIKHIIMLGACGDADYNFGVFSTVFTNSIFIVGPSASSYTQVGTPDFVPGCYYELTGDWSGNNFAVYRSGTNRMRISKLILLDNSYGSAGGGSGGSAGFCLSSSWSSVASPWITTDDADQTAYSLLYDDCGGNDFAWDGDITVTLKDASTGSAVSWATINSSGTITIAPIWSDYVTNHGQTITVEVEATQTSTGSVDNQATFSVQFQSTILTQCYASTIDTPTVTPSPVSMLYLGPATATITLSAFTDTGSTSLVSSGYPASSCGSFSATVQSSTLVTVTQNSDTLYTVDHGTLPTNVGVHTLQIQIASNTYSSQIAPITVTVQILVVCNSFESDFANRSWSSTPMAPSFIGASNQGSGIYTECGNTADISFSAVDQLTGAVLSWVTRDSSGLITITPTHDYFITYDNQLMNVEFQAALTSDSTQQFTETMQIQFPDFETVVCESSLIDTISHPLISIGITDTVTQVQIQLAEITDSGTTILEATPGYEDKNCGTFTVSHITLPTTAGDLTDLVTQDSTDQLLFHATGNENFALADTTQKLSIQVVSDKYGAHMPVAIASTIPDYIFDVSIWVFCDSVESNWITPAVWMPITFDQATTYALAGQYQTCGQNVPHSALTFRFFDLDKSSSDILPWITAPTSTTIGIQALYDDFVAYHDIEMTVSIVITYTSDPVRTLTDTFNIHFFSTVLDKCYNSEIVTAEPIETIVLSLIDPTPVTFSLHLTDTGTEELATIAGFEEDTCGIFEVGQIDLFELVWQDQVDDRTFYASTHGDLNLAGEHNLTVEVLSLGYADFIQPLEIDVPVDASCFVTYLVDDGASGYSPMVPVEFPIETVVKLPLYEPDLPCFGLTNADVSYAFLQDPPEWLVLDEERREILVENEDPYLQGQTVKVYLKATLDALTDIVTQDFSISLLIPMPDEPILEEEVTSDPSSSSTTDSKSNDTALASNSTSTETVVSFWGYFAAELKDSQPPQSPEMQNLTISQKVSAKGEFTLTASDDFFYQKVLRKLLIEEPQNKTQILFIDIFQEADTDEDSLVKAKFEWIVREVTSTTITILLEFEDPLLVSSGGSIKHMVNATVSEDSSLFFVSSSGKKISEQDYVQFSPIPMQDTVEEGLQQAIDSAVTVTTIAFSGSSVLQVILGGSLQSIFGEIRVLQYLVYPIGFDLYAPLNLVAVHSVALTITTFDLLPAQEIYEKYTGMTFTESEPLTEGLASLGLENLNFLLNGATVLLTLQAWALIALVATLSALAAKRFCEAKSKGNRLAQWLDKSLKWNFFFDFFFAAQIELVASALIQLKAWDWDRAESGDKVAHIFTIIIVVTFVIAVFFMYRIIRTGSKKKLFANKTYLSRFGALTEGLKTRTIQHLAFQFIMTARRSLLAALVVYDNLTTQMLCYRLMMVFILIYVGHFCPSWSHRYDLMHEIFLLIQAVLLPIYTDFVPDPQTRFTMGYVSAGFFVAQVFFSLIVIFSGGIKSVIRSIKRMCNKVKRWNQKRKGQEQLKKQTNDKKNEDSQRRSEESDDVAVESLGDKQLSICDQNISLRAKNPLTALASYKAKYPDEAIAINKLIDVQGSQSQSKNPIEALQNYQAKNPNEVIAINKFLADQAPQLIPQPAPQLDQPYTSLLKKLQIADGTPMFGNTATQLNYHAQKAQDIWEQSFGLNNDAHFDQDIPVRRPSAAVQNSMPATSIQDIFPGKPKLIQVKTRPGSASQQVHVVPQDQ